MSSTRRASGSRSYGTIRCAIFPVRFARRVAAPGDVPRARGTEAGAAGEAPRSEKTAATPAGFVSGVPAAWSTWTGAVRSGSAAVSRTRQSGMAAAQRAHISAIRHSLPARSAYTVRTTGPPHRTASGGRAPPRRPPSGSGVCHAQSAARQAHHAAPRGPPPARIRARCALTCPIAALRPAAAPSGKHCSVQAGREQEIRTAPADRRP